MLAGCPFSNERLLFESGDLTSIKNYFVEQCKRLLVGEVSILDLCFAKEVKMGTYM